MTIRSNNNGTGMWRGCNYLKWFLASTMWSFYLFGMKTPSSQAEATFLGYYDTILFYRLGGIVQSSPSVFLGHLSDAYRCFSPWKDRHPVESGNCSHGGRVTGSLIHGTANPAVAPWPYCSCWPRIFVHPCASTSQAMSAASYCRWAVSRDVASVKLRRFMAPATMW